MVFSLFGLKLGGDARKRRESPAGRAADTTLRGPTTSPLTDRDAAKRAVVAKIDAIESEMALDVIPEAQALESAGHNGSGGSAGSSSVRSYEATPARASARSAGPPAASRRAERAPARGVVAEAGRPAARDRRAPPQARSGAESEAQPGGAETSQLIGDEADAFSLEISGSGVPAEIEEAAILYSNNQAETALMLLRHAVEGNQLGSNAEQAWLMLLDLYQLTGRRTEFEDLAINYAARFETSPPTWASEQVAEPGSERERESAGAPPVMLPPIIDANAVRQLETVTRFLQRDGMATVDATAVASVDPIGAEILLRSLSAWAAGSAVLNLVNAQRLLEAARQVIETGRRDEPDTCWKLVLEMHRVLGQQQEFEDASIDYCVTYEVSPPSWEPVSASIRAVNPRASGRAERARAAVSAPLGAAQSVDDDGEEHFELAGELQGSMQAQIASLVAFAEPREEVVIECRRLRRIDFVSIGQLMGHFGALRSAGKQILVRNPNYMVAALLVVMGIHDLGRLQLRKP